MTLHLGIIGLGRWGPNHLRNFMAMPNVKVRAMADSDTDRLKAMTAVFPSVSVYDDYQEMLKDDQLDAVVICTPTGTHYEIVKASLQAGMHVLCEKPLTDASSTSQELVALQEKTQRVLMVGHVFLFNPGIQFVIQALQQKMEDDRSAAGKVYYLNAVRTNLGPFRKDVNAAWDLASHDIYIFNSILNLRPISITATGASFLRKGVEDINFLTLEYPGGIMGHIHVSWLDPKKVRQITVVCENKMFTWDDLAGPGPVVVHDRSIIKEPVYETFGEFQLLTREGDLVLPRIPAGEPLAQQARAFADRCLNTNNGETPQDQTLPGSARQGADVVDILEAADRSMANKGAREEIVYST